MSVLTDVKAILNITDTSEDATLEVYVRLASNEILAWSFGNTVQELPSWCEPICTMAVVEGYNQAGAEGETYQTVDGVTHSFSYPTMIEYIHRNAPGYAKLL